MEYANSEFHGLDSLLEQAGLRVLRVKMKPSPIQLSHWCALDFWVISCSRRVRTPLDKNGKKEWKIQEIEKINQNMLICSFLLQFFNPQVLFHNFWICCWRLICWCYSNRISKIISQSEISYVSYIDNVGLKFQQNHAKIFNFNISCDVNRSYLLPGAY